jgi:thiol-disulfide isomerase/thioredoxin
MKKIILLLFVSFFACNSNSNTKNTNDVSVRLINEAGLEQLLTQREGKSLFLNVWATWCVPCIEEFPDIVKLSKNYSGTNIKFVGLSVDYPDEIDSKIIPFLKTQQANFTNFVQNFDKQENLINRLNKDWNGALPATFIFSKRGKLISYLPGKHNYFYFAKELEKILH